MARFNPRARLDTSRMQEAGGGGGGGGFGGGGIGMPHIAGGGVGAIIIAVIIYAVQAWIGGGGGVGSQSLSSARMGVAQGGASADYSRCKTGDDANKSVDCALVAVENSLYDYWSQQPSLADALGGRRFQPENKVVTFEGSVQTGGCGSATTDVGPFYCSGDGNIYLDEAFSTTVASQLGIDANGPTSFVRAYVVAHEYGHHIQDLLGTINQVRTQQGPDSDSVRLERQADCYAGMWASAAANTKDSSGVNIYSSLTDQDIQDAIRAAGEVGDDYIQQRMGGSVDQSSFTHGTSKQREGWFQAGYRDSSGDLGVCDTFHAQNLSNPSSIS